MKMKLIENQTSDIERAFYGSKSTCFSNIKIAGPVDGESAFKECRDIEILHSRLSLRYPCWHNTNLNMTNTKLDKTARAPFWYDKNVFFNKVKCLGIKALRESKNITIVDSVFDSEEFGWKCANIAIQNSKITGFYAFFGSKDVKLSNVTFNGKYSFQYVHNLTIENCSLNTKDAFWHSKHVVVKNSLVKGEYLAWYSEDIVFENCHIVGTQPLCYAKGIRFIDCTFDECDFAFEFSEVNGNIKGTLISIKNPLSGHLVIDKIPEMIIDDFDRSGGNFSIETNK